MEPTPPTKCDLIRLGLKIAGETLVSRGRNFIYIPRSYASNPDYEQWKTSVECISYRAGKFQMSAFIDCAPNQPPDRIWLLFGGNASVALDWLPVTSFAPQSNDAFVLFDYPGFGDSEGKPERQLILRCIDELIENLIERFSIEHPEIGKRFHLMGHSLGAAMALETAVRYSIEKGILVAPFTSVHQMGEMMFGKWLPYLAPDRYDNIEKIKKLGETVPDSHYHIIHGTDDEIIPISMARDLHQVAPGHTTLWEIPDANHNDILLLLTKELGQALTNGGQFTYEKLNG